MSVSNALVAAIVAVLRAEPALAEVAVFDAPPVRASLPFVEVTPPVLADFGIKQGRGVEARVLVRAEDAGERAVRLRDIADAVGAAIEAMTGEVAGWDLGAVVMTRNRMLKRSDGRWVASVEVRMRIFEISGDI